jgi:hypothetical protein
MIKGFSRRAVENYGKFLDTWKDADPACPKLRMPGCDWPG